MAEAQSDRKRQKRALSAGGAYPRLDDRRNGANTFLIVFHGSYSAQNVKASEVNTVPL